MGECKVKGNWNMNKKRKIHKQIWKKQKQRTMQTEKQKREKK
jgi:hypothetical protein